jgi:hypothetical protein
LHGVQGFTGDNGLATTNVEINFVLGISLDPTMLTKLFEKKLRKQRKS